MSHNTGRKILHNYYAANKWRTFKGHLGGDILVVQVQVQALSSKSFVDQRAIWVYISSLNPTLFYDSTTLLSQVCWLSNVEANHATDCVCGLLRYHKSCIWSLAITLPTTHWTFTFHSTASWLYGNAWLAHKNKTSAQSERVTSLALVRGPHRPVPPWLPSRQTGDGRGLLQCGPLRTAAGFRSKSPLCHLLELYFLWISAPK